MEKEEKENGALNKMKILVFYMAAVPVTENLKINRILI